MKKVTNAGVFHDNLRKLFSCNFESYDLKSAKNVYETFRHQSLNSCRIFKGNCSLPTLQYLETLCRNSSVRIISTVVVPLSWMDEVVVSPRENIKMIHVIRDPRGTPEFAANKYNLTLDYVLICERMNEVKTA